MDENSTLYVSLNAPLNVSSRSVPQEAGSLERLEKDVAQIKSLAQTLDSESGLSGVDLISAAIPDLVSTIVMDPEESQKEHEIKAVKKGCLKGEIEMKFANLAISLTHSL